MKRSIISLFLFVVCILFMVGCGFDPEEAQGVVTELIEVESAEVQVTRAMAQEVAAVEPEAAQERAPWAENAPAGAGDLSVATGNRLQSQRLIIKNAEITLEVENSGAAVDGVIQAAVDYGGYIISQRVWQQRGHTFATITLGVPVGEFENAMRRLRTLADRVLDESASGTDVTDEYVDLGAKLENLQATRDRIRTFLEQATSVEESLEVNAQLSEIEGQIAEIQGRINYLAGRAAYSTITVQIEPIVPTPTVTPTPTATPVFTPTAEIWRPGETATRATSRLTSMVQSLLDAVIYNGIVCGPFLIVIAVIAWAGLRLWRRFSN